MHTAYIVTDLGFGDAGKGTIVDYLARTCTGVPMVVRHNGGAQAAHNVVTPAGVHHTFSQFGAGSFARNAHTFLSRFMLVDPYALAKEAAHLSQCGVLGALSRLHVDEDACIVTPFHKAGNRLRETLRGSGRHGSCGMGVGEAVADSLAFGTHTVRARDLRDPRILSEKLRKQQRLKREEFLPRMREMRECAHLTYEQNLLLRDDAPKIVTEELVVLARALHLVGPRFLVRAGQTMALIFEGAQGVLLDEWYGFHPYTTWSTTTTHNARALLSEANWHGTVRSIGVTRTYATRHGPGPFPGESSAVVPLLPEMHTAEGRYQGAMRMGWLDAPLLRYAVGVSGGIDEIAVTHLDRTHMMALRGVVGYRAPRSMHVVARATSGGLVDTLLPKKLVTDLAYQEALTNLLFSAEPAHTDVTDPLSFIAHATGKSIGITSYGPTALDKREEKRPRV